MTSNSDNLLTHKQNKAAKQTKRDRRKSDVKGKKRAEKDGKGESVRIEHLNYKVSTPFY